MFKWPWVSIHTVTLRDHFWNLELDTQRAMVLRLDKEIVYYRERYEAEKERADRAVDALVQWCGREPISAPMLAQTEKQSDASKAMQVQMSEIFGDVSDSIMDDTSVEGPGPEPSPVLDITERLAALRILPRYQKATALDESGILSITRGTIATTPPETESV